MRIHQVTQEDLTALCAFTQRIDRLMDQLCSAVTESEETYFSVADRWGHQDLPEYMPWMGPRYKFAGHEVPTSVFRGEGIALFLLLRILRPEVAIECYTGTGYASSWMAAGSPGTSVYTVDNYQEGGIGEEGLAQARLLPHNLALSNLVMLRGSIEELQTSLRGQRPAVYFSDGPRVDPIDLAEDAVIIRHDNLDGQAVGRSFLVRGGSNLSVMCSSIAERDGLMRAMARYLPVERCDA